MEQVGRTLGLLPLLSITFSHPGEGDLEIAVLPLGAGGAGEGDISVFGNITGQSPGPDGEIRSAGCDLPASPFLQRSWLVRYLARIQSFEDSVVKLLLPSPSLIAGQTV